MVATVGYQAGVESNDVAVSYALEGTYGVLPAVPFQAVRLTAETLAGTKQRTRPGEILTTGEVAAAVTQQETASGNVNFALSYGTYDDLIAGAVKNDWGATVAVSSAAGDITLSAGGAGTQRTLTSATVGKFTGIPVGAWIRVAGFVQSAGNGFFRVQSNTGLVLTFLNVLSTTAETPAGAAAQVRAGGMVNAKVFKSYHFQKALAPAVFLRYPGSFVTNFTLAGGVGQFLSGTFTLMSQQEVAFTVDASTGTVLPAPGGRVHDSVGGFAGVYLDGQPIAAVVDSFTLDVTASGAKQEYAMGSAAAAGQIAGLLEAKGTLKVYFKDFALYTRFKSEALGALSFITRDPAGNAYAITLLSATIMNPKVNAGGPSMAVMATFDIEGNPLPTGGTIQIDRLPGS